MWDLDFQPLGGREIVLKKIETPILDIKLVRSTIHITYQVLKSQTKQYFYVI